MYTTLTKVLTVNVLAESLLPAQAKPEITSTALRAQITHSVLVEFNGSKHECPATITRGGSIEVFGFMGRAKTGKVVAPAYVLLSDGHTQARMGGGVNAGLMAYDLAAVNAYYVARGR